MVTVSKQTECETKRVPGTGYVRFIFDRTVERFGIRVDAANHESRDTYIEPEGRDHVIQYVVLEQTGSDEPVENTGQTERTVPEADDGTARTKTSLSTQPTTVSANSSTAEPASETHAKGSAYGVYQRILVGMVVCSLCFATVALLLDTRLSALLGAWIGGVVIGGVLGAISNRL
jgi:hypothetical protein